MVQRVCFPTSNRTCQMMDWLIPESLTYVLVPGAVMLLLAVWEVLWPRRRWQLSRVQRWTSNLGLALLNNIVIRVLIPLGLADLAYRAEHYQFGVFNRLALPRVLHIVLTIVLLDFIVYVQHVVFHKVPILWRLHLVHHADLDFDFTTGVRFHTLEMLLSFAIKAVAVVVLGGAVLGVILFELLLVGTSLFNHANIRLPERLEKWLRLVVVTPEMHRVHHSVWTSELNSNFGFNLPWWDFLFGTYRDQPQDGHEQMRLGLSWLRDQRYADRLPQMLALPFTAEQLRKQAEQIAHLPDSAEKDSSRYT